MPVPLDYDTYAVSTNADRLDGAMDREGRSLPAEQFPETLTAEGVTFNLGPTSDGKTNALACRGQQVKLPQGNYGRLYVLAAASDTAGGDVRTTLRIDGAEQPFVVQPWLGYVGQWDHREWPGNTSDPDYPWGSSDIVGLEPGYVRPAEIAWCCSHHHRSGKDAGDAFYQYCYVFEHGFDLPPDVRVLRLPDDPRVKIFAIAWPGGRRPAPRRRVRSSIRWLTTSRMRRASRPGPRVPTVSSTTPSP